MSKFNPCPFCGREPKPGSELVFYKCEALHGDAMLYLECGCGARMNDYTFNERDYDKRLDILAEKWNGRYESSEPTADA